jgi:hypothetical protein
VRIYAVREEISAGSFSTPARVFRRSDPATWETREVSDYAGTFEARFHLLHPTNNVVASE